MQNRWTNHEKKDADKWASFFFLCRREELIFGQRLSPSCLRRILSLEMRMIIVYIIDGTFYQLCQSQCLNKKLDQARGEVTCS
ncbi:hypothetical protein ABH14_19515 [Brevibacillus brevis]|nr:hypothetical protein [Brevibacillus brevis]